MHPVSITTDSDFMVIPPLDFTFSSMDPDMMCVNASIIDDSIDEPTEQLEFYFDNLPSTSATVGVPPTACVNIEDNDSECKRICYCCILLTLLTLHVCMFDCVVIVLVSNVYMS